MPLSSLPHVRGLVLAAGSGSRMGGPKALIRPGGGGPTLVERAVGVLADGGCSGVTVVVGAAAAAVADVLTTPTRVTPSSTGPVTDLDLVECADWAEGMGASLRAGLDALAHRADVDAVLVTLVDLPDVGAAVVRRLLVECSPPDASPPVEGAPTAALCRATYGAAPGHPTLIGRDHWAGVMAVARGDRGARDYFRAHEHHLVECSDLATGRDVDSPADLDR
jgi:CTP:molybdopterin cytidylyltransferase MocA